MKIQGEGEFGTKAEAIVKYLLYLKQKDPPAKALVFSSFHRMLDILAQALKKNGITFIYLKGQARTRSKRVQQFQTDKKTQVLLMSLRTDNSGLTLNAATHVFLCEPSLSQAIEEQAINRIYRIGQTRPTHVYLFGISNSIEARIRKQQERTAERDFESRGVLMRGRENLKVGELLDLIGLSESTAAEAKAAAVSSSSASSSSSSSSS